jgi:hypothetical protein
MMSTDFYTQESGAKKPGDRLLPKAAHPICVDFLQEGSDRGIDRQLRELASHVHLLVSSMHVSSLWLFWRTKALWTRVGEV